MIELFLIAIVLNFCFFFYIKKIKNFVNIFDKPDNKLKKHKSKTPLLGGIIIMMNLCLLVLLSLFFEYQYIDNKISLRSYFSIFFLFIIFFYIGNHRR